MQKDVSVLSSARLCDAGFKHGFSTRAGGVSRAPFDAMDFAMLRDPDALRENTRRFAHTVGFDAARLYQAKQVHSAHVLSAEGDPIAMREIEADAIVARSSGAAACVRVADCVPILVGDTKTGRVAAIHAGWRGVVGHVIGAAIAELAPDGDVIAAIGPSIGPCCFEVGDDVAETIARAVGDDVVVKRFTRENTAKSMVDLRRAVRAELRARGVASDNIEDVAGCTRCDSERFYSYRRDGDASGRHVAVIVAR